MLPTGHGHQIVSDLSPDHIPWWRDTARTQLLSEHIFSTRPNPDLALSQPLCGFLDKVLSISGEEPFSTILGPSLDRINASPELINLIDIFGGEAEEIANTTMDTGIALFETEPHKLHLQGLI